MIPYMQEMCAKYHKGPVEIVETLWNRGRPV